MGLTSITPALVAAAMSASMLDAQSVTRMSLRADNALAIARHDETLRVP